jgi:hypothetical protein
MGRTKDLRCVICGKRPDETGSAKKFVKGGPWAMAHLDCYGRSDVEIAWVDWILGHACGLHLDKPSSDCPNYLLEAIRNIEKARDAT